MYAYIRFEHTQDVSKAIRLPKYNKTAKRRLHRI
jgi:hypothetical protein